MIHINKFIDKIKVTESKFDRNFVMTTREAKDLHSDITKLLLAIHELTNKSKDSETEIIDVKLSGDDW